MKRKLLIYIKLLNNIIKERFSYYSTLIIFRLNGVKHNGFRSIGLPDLNLEENAVMIIGNEFVIVNDSKIATLGRCNRCKFNIYKDAKLIIGNKVGMSNTTIVSTKSVQIGNNIIIGGGTTIVDSDFHSLNPKHWHTLNDALNMVSKPVIIKDNVFIGMDVIILKGITVGENAIISAGSVVVRNVPDNEIWGGNPAVFIKKREL